MVWKALFDAIAKYFRSPSRIKVIDMAERAFELSQKAMDEVGELRDQLGDCVAAEVECQRRFAESVKLNDELLRVGVQHHDEIEDLKLRINGLKALVEDSLPRPRRLE